MSTQTRFVSGLPETHCGEGSTLARTEVVRAYLPNLCRRLGVDTLLDAPCGDCNWISRTDLGGIYYFGMDIDPQHVEVAQHRLSTETRIWTVQERNVVRQPFHAVDLLLCRQSMQHWTNEQIHAYLGNWRESGITWLLATSHRVAKNYELDGNYRPVDLRFAPYSLGQPVEWIEDCDADLALWRAREV